MRNVIPKYIRDMVYKRDLGTCQKCWNLTTDNYQFHHKRSTGSGGSNYHENLILVCGECHHKTHTGEIKI